MGTRCRGAGGDWAGGSPVASPPAERAPGPRRRIGDAALRWPRRNGSRGGLLRLRPPAAPVPQPRRRYRGRLGVLPGQRRSTGLGRSRPCGAFRERKSKDSRAVGIADLWHPSHPAGDLRRPPRGPVSSARDRPAPQPSSRGPKPRGRGLRRPPGLRRPGGQRRSGAPGQCLPRAPIAWPPRIMRPTSWRKPSWAAPHRIRRAGRFATLPSTGFAPRGSRVPIPAASPDCRPAALFP